MQGGRQQAGGPGGTYRYVLGFPIGIGIHADVTPLEGPPPKRKWVGDEEERQG